jgi:iron complex transport system substrate-binding protein
MEWMIPAAGGRSVLHGSTDAPHPFTIEELLALDPDVLFCMTTTDRELLLGGPRFRGLTAVRTGRVHVAPTGGHSWGNGSAEQPLGLIWTARHLHPERFAAFDLIAEARHFYQRFYDTRLTDDQIRDILAGG